MLLCRKKYLYHFLQRSILSIGLLFVFAIAAPAQNSDINNNTSTFQLNPLLRSSFKKTLKTNPTLSEYIKPTKYELMRWPNYPLTAAQIAERDKKYDRPIGQQIANEILESTINNILSGKKTPVAVRPKF